MHATTASFTSEEVAALARRMGATDAVDLDQLRMGMEVELEHGRTNALTNVTDDDALLTAKIALAHLRELPDYYTRLARMEAGGMDRELRVRDLMTLEPVTVRGGAPLVVADMLMRQFGVSGLPVIDGQGELIGVLSRTDLMALAGDPQVDAWQGRSVAATMTAPSLTVEADASLVEAAARMEEHRVHRLVVVEPEGGRPIGILSTTDIVRAVASMDGSRS
jgi:CBS domain-containing protein